jgi:hypothetical protein
MDGKFRFYAFFEQFSYKTLFISSYQTKDMNFARYTFAAIFEKTDKKDGNFLTETKSSPGH